MNRYPIVMPILFAISTACALPAAAATVASVTFNYGGFGTVTDLGDNAYVSRSEGTENGSGSGTATAVAGLGALKAAAESEYKINATGTTRSIVSFSAVYLAGTSGFDDPVLDFFVNLDGSVTGNYAPGVNSNQWRVRGTLSVGYTSPVTGLAVSTSATPVDLQGRAGNQSIAGSLGLSVTVAAGTKVQVSGKLDITASASNGGWLDLDMLNTYQTGFYSPNGGYLILDDGETFVIPEMTDEPDLTAVPLPAGGLLLGTGLMALGLGRRRRR